MCTILLILIVVVMGSFIYSVTGLLMDLDNIELKLKWEPEEVYNEPLHNTRPARKRD